MNARLLDRAGVLEGIRKAGKKLGRAPTWAELRRLAGVPESRVRAYFGSLAEAVRAAGLEPGRTGLRIETEDLLKDWARVAAKLGRSPSRTEYLREGKYSAGAYYARFGSWPAAAGAASNWQLANSQTPRPVPRIDADPRQAGTGERGSAGGSQPGLTTEGTEEHGEGKETRPQHESDKAIVMQWAGAMTALPGDLAGKRRVTDAVCAMIVNTLMGAEATRRWELAMRGEEAGNQHSAVSIQEEGSTQHSAVSIQPRDMVATLRGVEGDGGQNFKRVGLARVNGEGMSGGVVERERALMGPPFHWDALTNAPINELGVVFLFGMLAGELGFQVESLRAGFPDCEAKRQIAPGKWQRVRIEFEFESRSFAVHGHDAEQCDVIVCWRHNWAKCPERIEVVELSGVVRSP